MPFVSNFARMEKLDTTQQKLTVFANLCEYLALAADYSRGPENIGRYEHVTYPLVIILRLFPWKNSSKQLGGRSPLFPSFYGYLSTLLVTETLQFSLHWII